MALFYYRYGICYVLDNNRSQVIFLRADIQYKTLYERMHKQCFTYRLAKSELISWFRRPGRLQFKVQNLDRWRVRLYSSVYQHWHCHKLLQHYTHIFLPQSKNTGAAFIKLVISDIITMSNRLPFYSDLRITFRDSIFLLPVPVRHAATPSARCVGVCPTSIYILTASFYYRYRSVRHAATPSARWVGVSDLNIYPILQQLLCRCCTQQ